MAVKQGVNVGMYLSGQPVMIPDCNIVVTQPKIKDIVLYGEDEFLVGTTILAHPERILDEMREGNPELDYFSDFQLLMIVLREDPGMRQRIFSLLEFVFPEYEIKLTESCLDFYKHEEDKTFIAGRITDFNFDIFKDYINDLFDAHSADNKEVEYNPANDLASQIAEKLKKGRERKAKQQHEKEGPQSIYGRYASILSIGLGISVNTIYEYTSFQLFDGFNRFLSKQESDFYQRVSTMPFMDVSKVETPEDWVRNLYKRQ